MYLNCSFDRCSQAHKKTKKEKQEHSLHQKFFIWQSLASRTGNLGQGIEDGVMRGEGVQEFEGRIKTQLFDSDVGVLAKGNARAIIDN